MQHHPEDGENVGITASHPQILVVLWINILFLLHCCAAFLRSVWKRSENGLKNETVFSHFEKKSRSLPALKFTIPTAYQWWHYFGELIKMNYDFQQLRVYSSIYEKAKEELRYFWLARSRIWIWNGVARSYLGGPVMDNWECNIYESAQLVINGI